MKTTNERFDALEKQVRALNGEVKAVLRSIPWGVNTALKGLRDAGKISAADHREIADAVTKAVAEQIIHHLRLQDDFRSASDAMNRWNQTHR